MYFFFFFLFFFLNTQGPVCTPNFSLDFPISLRKATRHFPSPHGINVSEKCLMSAKPRHGRPATCQRMLFMRCEEPGPCLRHLHSPLPLGDPGWGGGRRRPQSSSRFLLQSSASFPGVSLAPRAEFIPQSETEKSQPLSLHIISHQTHFHPRKDTHIVCKENKPRSIFSRLSKQTHCSSTCLSLEAQKIHLCQPGSEVIEQGNTFFFNFYKIYPMVGQFEKPPCSSPS